MTVDLTSVNAKIDRAYEHLNTLKSEVEDFSHRYPYGFRHYVQDQGRHHVGRLDIYRDPPLRFGILIGDSAHNFRSALDHFVAALAKALDPLAFRKHEADLAYPICTVEEAWKAAIERHRLEGIPGPIRESIQRQEPYKTHNPPDAAPLAMVRWLDERDKHRLIHAVSSYMVPTTLTFSPTLNPERSRLRITNPPYTEPSTEVFDLTLLDPIPQMQVNLQPALQISIRDAPISDDARVMLEHIGQTIQRIVFELTKMAAK